MSEFLLKRDLWNLDLASSLMFGLGAAYLIRTAGRIIYEATWERILFEMLLALGGYLATFVAALSLQKKLKVVPSWAWMGLVGTLAYLVLRRMVYFYPIGLEYYRLTSDTTSAAIRNAFLNELESVITAAIMLVPFACLSIFAMRFVAYFTLGKNRIHTEA